MKKLFHATCFFSPVVPRGRRVARCVLGATLAMGLASLLHASATITLTPTYGVISSSVNSPSFSIAVAGNVQYDANGIPEWDRIDDVSVTFNYSSQVTHYTIWGASIFTTTFVDPRGSLGPGVYSHAVGATGSHAVPYDNGWVGGYWEDEHDNPDDPSEVTGGHYVGGTHYAGFTWVGGVSFGSVSLQLTLQNPTAQSITFANPGTQNLNAVVSLGATTSSGLPVSYSLPGGVGSLNGATFTATTAGMATVRASASAGLAGATYFSAASPVDQVFFVAGLSQTISSFPAVPTKTFLDAPFVVAATASSGLPVTFAIVSGPATVSGSTVTLTGAGTVTLMANQSGNGTYGPVSTSQTFRVPKANQTINFPVVPTQSHGTAGFSLGATSSAGLPVAYTVIAGPATVYGNMVYTSAPGTVTIQASQAGNLNFNAAAVSPTQTIAIVPAITVTQTSTGISPPTFSIAFNPNRHVTSAQLTVYDTTDGVLVGTFSPASWTAWSNFPAVPYPINYWQNTSTWTDPRGLPFNGTHTYQFGISGSNPWSGGGIYGPFTATGTITGGPPGDFTLVPGSPNASGGPASFSVTINNKLYGSGVTSWQVRDMTSGQVWSYPTGAIADSYTTAWIDPRVPTPSGPRTFAFTAFGTSGGAPYQFTSTATYNESALLLQPVAPSGAIGPTQPKFNVTARSDTLGLTYIKVESAGFTWFLRNGLSPTTTATSIAPATSFSQQFADPRGAIGYGPFAYTVTAYGKAWVSAWVWIADHWVDEYDDPDDPGLVTGSHWVDGAWGPGYEISDWAILAQETITPPETVPPDTIPPCMPGALLASANTANSFTLSWAASSDNIGVTGYEIRRNGLPIATTTTTTWSANGLVAGGVYTIEVCARDAAGNRSAWGSLAVSTLNATAAVGLNAVATAAHSATLVWNLTDDRAAFAGYRIYRSVGGGSPSLAGTTSDTTFSDTALANDTAYTYSLRRLTHGETETGDLASVVISTTTGTSEDRDADGIPTSVETALGTSGASPATRYTSAPWSSNIHRPN